MLKQYKNSGGSRIFPRGAPTPKSAIIFQIFAENCMKMKVFGPQRGAASLAPPLDQPLKMNTEKEEESMCRSQK